MDIMGFRILIGEKNLEKRLIWKKIFYNILGAYILEIDFPTLKQHKDLERVS
jgi:hypothetical protein